MVELQEPVSVVEAESVADGACGASPVAVVVHLQEEVVEDHQDQQEAVVQMRGLPVKAARAMWRGI